MNNFRELRDEWDSHTKEEKEIRLQKYHQLPKSWTNLFGKPYELRYNWKRQEWLKVYDYDRNHTLVRKDNMNPLTEGRNITSGCPQHFIRIPSKKHKNRYKNFLKLFPNYGK